VATSTDTDTNSARTRSAIFVLVSKGLKPIEQEWKLEKLCACGGSNFRANHVHIS
jgi:hypothetical protein